MSLGYTFIEIDHIFYRGAKWWGHGWSMFSDDGLTIKSKIKRPKLLKILRELGFPIHKLTGQGRFCSPWIENYTTFPLPNKWDMQYLKNPQMEGTYYYSQEKK